MKGIWNILGVSLLFLVIAFLTFGVGLLLLPLYYYLVFKDSSKRIDRNFKKLEDTLIENEQIIHKGIDQRPFALLSRRQVFCLTNSRVIILKRGLFGGYKMSDFQWKDLFDATISELVLPSICGSQLNFFDNMTFPDPVYPDSEVASKMYRYAQDQEQAWEEKNRIRKMEEKRASSGGIQVGALGGQQQTQPQSTNSSTSNIADELLKLKQLLDQGILSDAEFNEMKAKLLSGTSRNF